MSTFFRCSVARIWDMIDEPTKADPPIAAGKPCRRWFQYSLRSLMVLVLLAGIGMTWLVAIKNRAERQKMAVETILKGGGFVVYDFQMQILPSGASNYTDNATPPGPAWLRKVLGDDFFTNVVGARIVTEAGLDQIELLSRLQKLELNGVMITDSRLEQLKQAIQLDALTLDNTNIADAGLEKLAGLRRLETLSLARTQVTDAGLEKLAQLRQIKYLDLSWTKVTDTGLKHLRGLTQLQELRLGNTRITGVGLEQLCDLPQLHNLYVDDTQLTDAGALSLSRLSQLQKLDLDGTPVTDTGMEALRELKNLRGLQLSRTRTHVTDEGVAKLHRALPDCQIYR